MLPVDGETCIFVHILGDYGNVFSIRNYAFVCSMSTVREIGVPSKLEEAIQILAAPNQSPHPQGQIFNANVGYADPFLDYEWTPTVFQTLNEVRQFTDPLTIQQFPSSLKPVTIYYPNNAGQSLYYAEWLGDPFDVDFSQTALFLPLPESTLSLPPSFQPPRDPVTNSEARILFAWDWDNPDYCRRMCLALGFSAADLQP